MPIDSLNVTYIDQSLWGKFILREEGSQGREVPPSQDFYHIRHQDYDLNWL